MWNTGDWLEAGRRAVGLRPWLPVVPTPLPLIPCRSSWCSCGCRQPDASSHPRLDLAWPAAGSVHGAGRRVTLGPQQQWGREDVERCSCLLSLMQRVGADPVCGGLGGTWPCAPPESSHGRRPPNSAHSLPNSGFLESLLTGAAHSGPFLRLSCGETHSKTGTFKKVGVVFV